MAEGNLVEVWRSVPFIEYIEASSLGQIRSLPRISQVSDTMGRRFERFYPGKTLKQRLTKAGYRVIMTCEKAYQVHRLVCWAFNGTPPSESHQTAHLNGIRVDNRPKNLIWATAQENSDHKKIHGTMIQGEKHDSTSLCDMDVYRMLQLYAQGTSSAELSAQFGASISAIRQIICGKSWKHISSPYRDAVRKMAQKNIFKSLKKGWDREYG